MAVIAPNNPYFTLIMSFEHEVQAVNCSTETAA